MYWNKYLTLIFWCFISVKFESVVPLISVLFSVKIGELIYTFIAGRQVGAVSNMCLYIKLHFAENEYGQINEEIKFG